MLRYLFPDEEQISVYQMDFCRFYCMGYRGIIFDIDNTLVPHGNMADQQAKELFCRLHGEGFQTILLSNNKEPRVKSFSEDVHSGYIYKAGKPGTRNYRKAMELMGVDKKTTMFVGDQIFTDVFGAKKAGIYTVLVRPINPREEIQIVLKRYLEAVVLFFYHKKSRKEKMHHGKSD